MSRIEQTQDELEGELENQIRFLMQSCYSFDAGDHAEAKRISAILRTLLKDKGQSKSLLGQLSKKGDFVTYYHLLNATVSTQRNFIISSLLGNDIHQYVPNFVSATIDKKMLQFGDWWNQEVIIDFGNNLFSREKVVLSVAETDGGSHVDPGLETAYYNLTRLNSQEIFVGNADFSQGFPQQFPKGILQPGMPPVWHTLRQIAHEVIESLGEPYDYKPETYYTGLGISGLGLMGR